MPRGLAGEEDVEDEENGADGDSGVGYVEGGPAIGAEKDFEKIGDPAVEDTIGDIAGCSAEEESESGGVEGSKIFASDQQPSDDGDDGNGSYDKEYAECRRGRASEEAEGNAGITALNQVEEIMDDFVAPGFGGLRFDQGLGGAIEKDDGEGEPDPAEAGGESHW